MNDLYQNKGEEVQTSFSFSSDVLAKALQRIYSQIMDVEGEIEPNLFHEICRILDDAAADGVAQSEVEQVDDFLQQLQINNEVFAAFKVHRMQRDMARLLLDSNGTLKPFEKWAQDVKPIASHQVYHWLQTEYDTAVLRAHQAADWQQFLRERDVLPNLKWMPSTSLHPGADHRPFWNTIRPIDDPFWNKHRPGDRWNCKCDLTATDEEPTQLPDEDDNSTPQPGLDNNPGTDGKLFSDKHPYVTNAYPGAKEAVEKFLKEQSHYQKLPVRKGRLRIHEGHGKNEKAENIRIGTYLAEKHGYAIDLLDNPNDVKSADSYNWTLGVEQEYKLNNTATKNSIDNLLRSAARQAGDIVLWIEADISYEDLAAALRSRVRRNENIQSVTIIRDGKDIRLSRNDIISEGFKIRPADLK